MKPCAPALPRLVVGLLAAGFSAYGCSGAWAVAVEAVPEMGRSAVPTLSVPVIGALSAQLLSLSQLQSFDPAVLSVNLSRLAAGADPVAEHPSLLPRLVVVPPDDGVQGRIVLVNAGQGGVQHLERTHLLRSDGGSGVDGGGGHDVTASRSDVCASRLMPCGWKSAVE